MFTGPDTWKLRIMTLLCPLIKNIENAKNPGTSLSGAKLVVRADVARFSSASYVKLQSLQILMAHFYKYILS